MVIIGLSLILTLGMDVVSGARRSSMMFVLFLCLVVGHVSSFRITRLDVPSQVTEGSTARMACEYELVPYRKLYTVRWMKNNVEFYRYDPNSEERHNFYRIHGLHVNVSSARNNFLVSHTKPRLIRPLDGEIQ